MGLNKLLIATALLAGLAGLVYWSNKHPKDTATTTPATTKLMDVPEAKIASVEIQKRGNPPVTLAKEGSKWAVTTPANYPADQDAATSLLLSFGGLNADSVVDENPGDLAKFGLTNPSVTVAAHETNGKTDKLILGDDVPTGSTVYAQVPGDKKVYTVSSSLKSSLGKDVNDLRDKRLMRFDPTQVSRVELAEPKADIEFGKVNQSDWQIVKPQPYRADSFQVEDLLRKLADAKMDLTVKPEDSSKAEAAFNSGKPVAVAKVTDAGGVQTLDVRQNKDDYYAKSGSVPGVFKMTADLGKAVGKPLDDYRNKKLFDFGFSDLNKLQIDQKSGSKTYLRSGTDWKMGSQTMDAGSVQSVIDKLRDLAATDFVPAGFNAADVTITAVSNDNKRTEKVELSKTADGYIARREGQPTLYKLDSKSVNDILEAATGIKATASGTKK
jgi:hypothetical protein